MYGVPTVVVKLSSASACGSPFVIPAVQFKKKREATADRNTMKQLLCEEQVHLNLVRAERLAYGKRIAEATHGDSDVGSMAADGADQGAYGLPYYCQVKQ